MAFHSIPHTLQALLQTQVANLYALELPLEELSIETPKAGQGDFATTLPFLLAKRLKKAPKEIGTTIAKSLEGHPLFLSVTFAMPGFINFQLHPRSWQDVLPMIIAHDPTFYRPNVGEGKKVYLEYISANPTGPLHVGHARCAALGSFLANLLHNNGYQVHQEYLINDAGFQIQTLALSVWLRFLQHQGSTLYFPSSCYQGGYIQSMAQALAKRFALSPSHPLPDPTHSLSAFTTFCTSHYAIPAPTITPQDTQEEEAAWFTTYHALYQHVLPSDIRTAFEKACAESILAGIQADCLDFSVQMNTWFSEKTLHDSKALDACMEALAPHTYQKDGALWFASSAFGDSKDRVLKRSNGVYTYFAADVAYHLHKIQSKPDIIIDIFGADHHGYAPRLSHAVNCLKPQSVSFEVIIYQFVNLFKGGVPYQMSTRSGTYVTLKDLCLDIGSDCARFYLLSKKPDVHISFDLEEASAKTQDNPLYRIHYAHARCQSLLRKHSHPTSPNTLAALDSPHEITLLKILHTYPKMLLKSEEERSAHLLCHWLTECANALHSYYAHTKIIQGDLEKDPQRLYLIGSCQKILHEGLGLLGIKALDRM